METTPQVTSDLAPTTIVGNLDLSKRVDRQMLRRSLTDGTRAHKPRWGGLSDELKGKAVAALAVALDKAVDQESIRDIKTITDALVQMEGQNQSDEQLREKYDRLDEGKETDGNRVEVVYVNKVPPRES